MLGLWFVPTSCKLDKDQVWLQSRVPLVEGWSPLPHCMCGDIHIFHGVWGFLCAIRSIRGGGGRGLGSAESVDHKTSEGKDELFGFSSAYVLFARLRCTKEAPKMVNYCFLQFTNSACVVCDLSSWIFCRPSQALQQLPLILNGLSKTTSSQAGRASCMSHVRGCRVAAVAG